ncbi:MAG: c-type cytochrome [Burkholderiaceae bacterium]|nr:c-type cytochrome [Burkholderiaceae bacterium]
MKTRLKPATAAAATALTLAFAAGPLHAQVGATGRLLASNCFQCHGTNGKGPGFDDIAGKSVGEIAKKLKEFRAGKEGNGIMAKHANGYTDEQLVLLDKWLSTQR